MFDKCRERITYLALMLITQSFGDDFESFSFGLASYFFFTFKYLQEISKSYARYKSIYGIHQT